MTQEEIQKLPHKMVDGVAILLTPKEIEELTFVSDEEKTNILNNTKINKIREVKSKRDTFLNSNITVSTGEYKATQTAKSLFFNAVNGITWRSTTTLPWRLADDITWVKLTKEDAYELYDAFQEQETSGYQQESGFIRSINNAQTVEDVNSIIIEFK